MKEYIITHKQLERLFGWIDQLTLLVHGEEAEPFIGKRLALYEQLEVPPIVRCKDCKHFTPDDEFFVDLGGFIAPGATVDSCDLWAGTKCKTLPDGFCYLGEPREGNDK